MGAKKGNDGNGCLEGVKYVSNEIPNQSSQGLESEVEVIKSDTLYLYFTVITGVLLWMVGGTTIVWPSSAIVKFKSNDPNINPLGRSITAAEISMLLGIPGICSLSGPPLLSRLADIMGRKKSLQILGFMMFISIIGIAFSTKIEFIIAFSTILSFFFCGVWCILPIYLTEICEDHNRSKFGCIMGACLPLGQLYTYIIGSSLSYMYFTLLTAVPMIPFLFLFFFAPESPVYSLVIGRENECKTSIKRLRSNKSQKQLNNDYIKMEESSTAKNEETVFKGIKLFRIKEGRIGVMLGMIPLATQHLCGVPVLMPLMAPILNESGSNVDGETIAIFVGIVKVCTYSLASLTVENVGKKPLLIISSAGTSIFMSTLGLFFYLKYVDSPIVHQYQWIPLVCILIYFFFYGLGLGPIPMTIVNELFPADLRTTGSAVISTTVALLMTCYVSAYPLLSEAIGIYWCMWIFASISAIGVFLVYFLMPETKGKSLIEIQQILKKY